MHPLMKLQSFDGTGSLNTFLSILMKFQHMASNLHWDDEDMFHHLFTPNGVATHRTQRSRCERSFTAAAMSVGFTKALRCALVGCTAAASPSAAAAAVYGAGGGGRLQPVVATPCHGHAPPAVVCHFSSVCITMMDWLANSYTVALDASRSACY